jgi:hypothetical protein
VAYLDNDGNFQKYGEASWDNLRGLLTSGPAAFAHLGLGDRLPKGFILVPPTAVARLELLERGFAPILGEFRRVVQSPEFSKALKLSGIGGMPFYAQCGDRPGVAFAHRYICDGTLAEAMKDVFYPDIIALLSGIQVKEGFNDEAHSRRMELECALGPMWRFLGVDDDAFMSWAQVADVMDERYPALPIVSLDRMRYGSLHEIMGALKAVFAKRSEPVEIKLAA